MRASRGCAVLFLLCMTVITVQAQKVSGNLRDDLKEFVQTPAIPGYEQELAGKIAARVQGLSPKTDNLGSVIVTVGTGTPHRLIVAPMDEPGFVVTNITAEGYLRVQRLPQGGPLPLFNELYSAQPVMIGTTQQKWISGAVAGLSIHLQPGRQHPPSAADLDDTFIDIGAASAQEARAGGADLLSPLVIERTFHEMGNANWTSPAIGDRFGAAVLLEVLRHLDPQKLHGTTTVAFVTQQWTDSRGLDRMVQAVRPEELIYVGRLIRGSRPPNSSETASLPSFTQKPGSGVLVASANPQEALSGFAGELKQLAAQNNISFNADFSAPITPPTARGSVPKPPLPARTVHLAVATAWPSTPAEYLDAHDLMNLAALLETYLQGQSSKPELPPAQTFPHLDTPLPRQSSMPSNEKILQQLIEAYGVSGGHESGTAQAITALLPSWARPQMDSSGNMVLRWAAPNAPHILVVAHQDEIGFEVHSILPDGRLDLESKGGGVLAFFLGHAALVHSANGMHPGVMELPDGWEKQDFQWPRGPRTAFRMDVGASNPEQATQLGIKVGDFVTIPKRYHKLLGTRASARAFDDRIGCAALVSAVWALGPNLKDRDVTFVWSTGEELGLLGAADIAKRLAAEGQVPDYVFAVDTFVSSDSPTESKRFADAILGQGFVVRAVDNSNIVPRPLVDKLVSMAHAQKIPVQYGATGGGNDGSAFLQYGSVDVALGWPLRYSHSPGEVIDTRDLDALAKIITQVAKSW